MQKLFLVLLISLVFIIPVQVNAQQPKLATFHETAQVIFDDRLQNQTIASISVLSTSNQEILVPVSLDEKIHGLKNVTAVVITNQDKCVLGVVDSACVLINISKNGFSGGIGEAQKKGREIGDSLIDDINRAFHIESKFNSVFIHVDDTLNKELDTSGVISGRGTVSVVYTFSKYDSSFLFEGLTTLLIPKEIKNSGGFLDIAKKIADDPTSSVTFSIIPKNNSSVFQLQVSRNQPIANDVTTIDTLQYFGIKELERSKYFSQDFFPLNSLIQVVIFSKEPTKIATHQSPLVPTVVKDGEIYPSDLSKNGWLFDPVSGETIIGKYLFGTTEKVTQNELSFSIGKLPQKVEPQIDGTVYILMGIGVAAAIAIIWYLKSIKRSKD